MLIEKISIALTDDIPVIHVRKLVIVHIVDICCAKLIPMHEFWICFNTVWINTCL